MPAQIVQSPNSDARRGHNDIELLMMGVAVLLIVAVIFMF
jgi:predicted nucleic acid-binding Zn ribbon protein